MKLGYVGDSSYRAVLEHTKDIALNITEETDVVIMESSLTAGPPDLPCLNTCKGVRAMAGNEELTDAFNQLVGVQEGYAKTFLYGFVGTKGLSQLLEMTYTTRFLTGDVGPQIGFVQGTGIACDKEIMYAIPDLSALETILQDMEYRGEIVVGITAEYKICSVLFGHFTGGFSLYNELLKGKMQDAYKWCLGKGDAPILHYRGISVTTMISHPPYPHNLELSSSVKAPAGAEKHLYRMMIGNSEIAYSAAWGKDIFEAKRRCKKTIENCTAYSKDIQHRIDYGNRQRFVVNHEQWLQFKGKD